MKICDEKVAPEASENKRCHIKTPTQTQNPTQQTSSGGNYSSYYSDPLAADEPGEELLPGAAVWTIYKKEATEYDNELVKGRNENLDTMLIFAALFSAILTAFLIESTSLLQEDHAETSAALLLLLVQSSLGATNASSMLPGSSFTPAPSARWVNGLWFAALGLSLAAALLAMLAKEWLDAFVTSHKRAPYAYTVTRQARLDGFEAWGAPHIMDLLPTLLHISLLLFALGLVVYLWRLDQAIAIMLCFIIGVTCLLYLGTVVCGAVYQFCPFITRLSRYLQVLTRAISQVKVDGCNNGPSYKKPDFNKELTVADLRALIWLAKNARDQESGNSTYQALAGLKKRKMKSLLAYGTKQKHHKILKECHNFAHFLEGFATGFESALTKSPRELAKCRGEIIVRYTQALPEIVNCVGTFMDSLYQAADQGRNYTSNQLGDTSGRAMDLTLKFVDEIWNGRYEFDASVYAYVAASELRSVQAIITNEIPRNSQESLTLSQTRNENKDVGVVMDLMNQSRIILSPAQLWARYEASLGCATLLIYLHLPSYSGPSHWRGSRLSTQALLDLLEAIESTATFMLKLPPPYSQSSRDRTITYITEAMSGFIESYPSGHGLTTDIPHLLRELRELSSTSQPDLALSVRHASARAMSAVGLLHAQERAQSNHLDFTSWKGLIHVSGRLDWFPGQNTVLKAMMDLVFFAALRDPFFGPLGEILDSLLNLIKYLNSIASSELLGDLQNELVHMVRFPKESIESWPGEARSALIRVLAFELTGPVNAYKTKTVWANTCANLMDSLEPASWLLRIIQQTPQCRNEVKILLVDLANHLDEHDSPESDQQYRMAWALDYPYVKYFTQTPGFHELVEVGHNADYIPLVVQTIIQICTNSHFQQARSMNLRETLVARFRRVEYADLAWSDEGRRIFQDYETSSLVPHPQTISPIALPGFIDSVTLALDVIQSDKLEEPTDIPEFVECAMKLLNVSLIASRGEFNDDCGRKAGEVARTLREHGAPGLEDEAVGVIAQYGQYCELPTQTEDEIAILEDQSISCADDELGSLRGPTVE